MGFEKGGENFCLKFRNGFRKQMGKISVQGFLFQGQSSHCIYTPTFPLFFRLKQVDLIFNIHMPNVSNLQQIF